MSSSKAEKEEDDLAASISKSMTIPQLKKEIILADLWYGTKTKAKTKAEFVNIYISNGLHKRAATSLSRISPEERKAVASLETKAVAKSPPKSPETSPPTSLSASVSKAAARVEPKEELILSLMISAHGLEGGEWEPTTPISQYYKNNVRVYSRACLPGVPAVRNRPHVRKSIDEAFTIFKNNPRSSTQEIMTEYTGLDKNNYRNFLDTFKRCEGESVALKYKERCGGLTTYLSQKQFIFAEEYEGPNEKSLYKTEYDFNQFLESRGINVSDIRLKITGSDGVVTYRNIFNPYEEMTKFYRSNKEHKEPLEIITKFNLAYRHGIEFILKDILHKEELIGPALEIFKFKEGEKKKKAITLEQLYRFFELVGIKYVNIIDHTCRNFHPSFKLTEEKNEELFKKEQQYSVKPTAFGKRSDGKRSDGKRSSRRSTLKGKLSKHIYRKNKYSRKI
jgi:hypothetical protein